ncbi:MAG: hypothetical protein GF349_00570 [Candidatus Magasanikbacteria bacterium]|nr:hypothetical protein [Candidatus Magasanikbacteria bacterium]
MNKKVKISILTLMLFFIFLPDVGLAVDQRCFTRNLCEKRRDELGGSRENIENGFVVRPKECGVVQEADPETGKISNVELGFCLPAGQSSTEVSIGGRNTFANIGEYIKYAYRYGVQAAALLAILVMIFSGFQWAASGGNTDTISRAKKRITGAIIGLLIALGSFAILQTINPDLTKITVPQAWLINSMPLSPIYCDEIKDLNLALALTIDEKKTLDEKDLYNLKSERSSGIVYDINPQNKDHTEGKIAACGNEYFIQGHGDTTCIGTICTANPSVCHKRLWETDVNYQCYDATLAGNIYTESGGGTSQGALSYLATVLNDGWEWDDDEDDEGWLPDGGYDGRLSYGEDIKGFLPVCDFNGLLNAIKNSVDENENIPVTIVEDPKRDSDNFNSDFFTQFYALKVTESELNKADSRLWTKGGCSGNEDSDNIAGYVLVMEFNEQGDPGDEVHFLGYDNESMQMVDLGKIPTGIDFDSLFEYYNLVGCVTRRVDNLLFKREDLEKGVRFDINVDDIDDQDDDPEDLAEYYLEKAPSWGTIGECLDEANRILD